MCFSVVSHSFLQTYTAISYRLGADAGLESTPHSPEMLPTLCNTTHCQGQGTSVVKAGTLRALTNSGYSQRSWNVSSLSQKDLSASLARQKQNDTLLLPRRRLFFLNNKTTRQMKIIKQNKRNI